MKIGGKIKQSLKRNRKFITTVIIMTALIICGILLSTIRAWSDFYTDHIYTFLRDPITHITESIPFSLGEVLMYLGAILLFLTIPILILFIFLRKKTAYKAFVSGYFKSLVIIILSFLLIYTYQWLTPYRSSVLGNAIPAGREYTVEEMRALYIFVADHINEECLIVPRDEEGNVIYDAKEAAEQKVSVAMNNISNEFSRLSGYYPTIKPAMCSDVLDWMWIGGYTYPYTLETTYNKYINRFYFPSLYSHECSHHMGYYKEHEANFLSYLALANSDDPVLRYSGYYYVFRFVDDAYLQSCIATDNMDMYISDATEHRLYDQVYLDVLTAQNEAQELYLQDEHYLEDYADEAEEISDVGWSTQAEILQEYNYDGVVLLMLRYYDGKLF
ncbi:MAG: DUF3810 family protein [Lachnospiraceae bacterium]|nr:DUF3810 family protein [Lachnospiraceae bacterium]